MRAPDRLHRLATLDWIETAAETGAVDMDDELACLLRGE
jgi:hypothetical protein